MIALVCVLLAVAGAGVGCSGGHRSTASIGNSINPPKHCGPQRPSWTVSSSTARIPCGYPMKKGRIRLNQACRDLLNVTDDEVVGEYNLMRDSIVVNQGFLPLIQECLKRGKQRDSRCITTAPISKACDFTKQYL